MFRYDPKVACVHYDGLEGLGATPYPACALHWQTSANARGRARYIPILSEGTLCHELPAPLLWLR